MAQHLISTCVFLLSDSQPKHVSKPDSVIKQFNPRLIYNLKNNNQGLAQQIEAPLTHTRLCAAGLVKQIEAPLTHMRLCAAGLVQQIEAPGKIVVQVMWARQSHIIHQIHQIRYSQHRESRCGFAIFIGSQHLWCRGSQPKHVSNPAIRSLTHIAFMIDVFQALSTQYSKGDFAFMSPCTEYVLRTNGVLDWIRDVFWFGPPAPKVPGTKHVSNPDVAPF